MTWHPRFAAGKRQKPWPLERAEILQRQAETERALRAEAQRAYSAGKECGRDETLGELALLYAGREKLRDYIYSEAVAELGRTAGQSLGQSLSRTMERHKDVFSYADEVRRAAVDAAMLGVKIDARPASHPLAPLSTILRVSFERMPDFQILINQPAKVAA